MVNVMSLLSVMSPPLPCETIGVHGGEVMYVGCFSLGECLVS